MSSKSPRRSIPPNSPLDPSTLRVLRALDPIARKANCPYFVGGATARDLILVNVHGLQPGRATLDIDLGIAVENWQRFALLKELMVATGAFMADRRAQQRLIYSDRDASVSIPIDLIPFGGVTSGGSRIEWPPSRDIVMNVAGFEEALTSSVLIQIDEDLVVRVASIPGLTLLKLVAWSDRGRQTNKDAVDLYRLLTTYADAGNTDRLYDQEMDLLESAGFDLWQGGAELLGRDVRGLCSAEALGLVRSLLHSEDAMERLVNQMVPTSTFTENLPFVERILASFRRGFG